MENYIADHHQQLLRPAGLSHRCKVSTIITYPSCFRCYRWSLETRHYCGQVRDFWHSIVCVHFVPPNGAFLLQFRTLCCTMFPTKARVVVVNSTGAYFPISDSFRHASRWQAGQLYDHRGQKPVWLLWELAGPQRAVSLPWRSCPWWRHGTPQLLRAGRRSIPHRHGQHHGRSPLLWNRSAGDSVQRRFVE